MKSLAIGLQSNSFTRKNHRFVFTETELDYLAQKVRSVISIFLGEWFLDQSLGIPYIPKNDMKKGHRAILENALRVKITSIKGIKRLLYFNSVYQPGDRFLYVEFTAETNKGQMLEMKEKWITPLSGGNE
jgi:hypothetical protein